MNPQTTDLTQTIPLNKALEAAWRVAKKLELGANERKIVEKYLRAIPADNDGSIALFRLTGLIDNLQKAVRYNNPSFLEERRGWKVRRVPDVVEFVESKEYLNSARPVTWPAVLDDLWEIHHGTTNNGGPPRIIVLSGSAGAGKSETAKLSACYTRALLAMMWSPHLELNQSPDSTMVLVIQSIKLETADDSIFTKIRNCIDRSPWFQKYCPRQPDFDSEIRWPNDRVKIMPITGQWNAGLGKDVIWFVTNETNKAPIYERSKQLKNSTKNTLDVGKAQFTTLLNRIDTRFTTTELGMWISKGIVDSQRDHVGDFTDQMRERAKDDPSILIIERSLWEAKAHEYQADEPTFMVELGDEQLPPRIVESKAKAIDPGNIIHIPIRHKQRFVDDIEEALNYFVGKPPQQSGRFIPWGEKITQAQTGYVERFGDDRLFRMEEVCFDDLFGDLSEGEPVDWDLVINQDFINNHILDNPPCACHCDMSYAQDATGVAVSRIIGTKHVDHAHLYSPEDRIVREFESVEAPIYCTDGVLRIVAKAGAHIDLNLVRDLPLQLARYLWLRYCSADWLEAMSAIQEWQKRDIVSGHISVDKTPTAYYEIKYALRDNRWIVAPHQRLDRELRRLTKRIRGGTIKVDHPDGDNESKDVADACAGSIFVLRNREARYQQKDSESELEAPKHELLRTTSSPRRPRARGRMVFR